MRAAHPFPADSARLQREQAARLRLRDGSSVDLREPRLVQDSIVGGWMPPVRDCITCEVRVSGKMCRAFPIDSVMTFETSRTSAWRTAAMFTGIAI